MSACAPVGAGRLSADTRGRECTVGRCVRERASARDWGADPVCVRAPESAGGPAGTSPWPLKLRGPFSEALEEENLEAISRPMPTSPCPPPPAPNSGAAELPLSPATWLSETSPPGATGCLGLET